eukprot:3656679-Rhodomonas_salina.2
MCFPCPELTSHHDAVRPGNAKCGSPPRLTAEGKQVGCTSVLRTCYAMSALAKQHPSLRQRTLLSCYSLTTVMSGTDVAYGATSGGASCPYGMA